MVKKQFSTSIKVVQTISGGEFMPLAFNFEKCGIIDRCTYPYTNEMALWKVDIEGFFSVA